MPSTKANRATKIANKALGLFSSAHAELDKAVRLLHHAESEHLNMADLHHEIARGHEIAAEDVAQERDRHARVRDRIEELLS